MSRWFARGLFGLIIITFIDVGHCSGPLKCDELICPKTNLSVWFSPDPDSKLVALSLAFKGGTSSASHRQESLPVLYTALLNQAFADLYSEKHEGEHYNQWGISLGIEASFHWTEFSIVFPKKNLNKAREIFQLFFTAEASVSDTLFEKCKETARGNL